MNKIPLSQVFAEINEDRHDGEIAWFLHKVREGVEVTGRVSLFREDAERYKERLYDDLKKDKIKEPEALPDHISFVRTMI